jgi:hypothetical protein
LPWGFFGVLMACFGGAGVMIALIGQPGLSWRCCSSSCFWRDSISAQAGSAVAATYIHHAVDGRGWRLGIGRMDQSRSVNRRVHAAALFHASVLVFAVPAFLPDCVASLRLVMRPATVAKKVKATTIP